MHPQTNRGRQRGTTLVESLIAFLVLSLGLVGMAKLQSQLRLNADFARQRTEALRLAQEDMEGLRAFTTLVSTPSGHAYADIVPASTTVGPSNGYQSNTSFQVERSVAIASGFRTATVSVGWNDRTGQAQQVVLQSVIAATPPALSGALSVQTMGQTLKSVRGRSALIPLFAKDLGNGSSVFKPAAGGSVAFVVDNVSGALSSHCTGVAATVQTKDLSAADLSHCETMNGLLLSGVVRLSAGATPDPAHANDTPLPLGIALTLTDGNYPAEPFCTSETQKLVAIPTASGTRREAVPIAATPASWGVAGWTDLNERFVAYHCAVAPLQGNWSGRSALVPQGWAIGTGATDYRVCRYSADHDGSGAVDQNAEHPNQYDHVDRTLMQQNFLIVRGDQSCPTASAEASAYAKLGTVQHQP